MSSFACIQLSFRALVIQVSNNQAIACSRKCLPLRVSSFLLFQPVDDVVIPMEAHRRYHMKYRSPARYPSFAEKPTQIPRFARRIALGHKASRGRGNRSERGQAGEHVVETYERERCRRSLCAWSLCFEWQCYLTESLCPDHGMAETTSTPLFSRSVTTDSRSHFFSRIEYIFS